MDEIWKMFFKTKGTIFNFFPQNFGGYKRHARSFYVTIEQSTSCTITGQSFTRDQLYDSVPGYS